MSYPTEFRKFEPEACPVGTVVINRAGPGALLRVDAWNGQAVDFSGWEGMEPEVIGTTPPTASYHDFTDLYGVDVEVMVLSAADPEPVTEPEAPAMLTMADVLAKNLPASVAPVIEDTVEEEAEAEEVATPEPEAELVEEPEEEAEADFTGPPTGKYEGWAESKKAWVYQQVYDAGGVRNMTQLTIAAVKELWPKLAPGDVEEKVVGRIDELQADGYQISLYNDNNVVIGDWPDAQPITLEQYLSGGEDPEPEGEEAPEDPEPEATVDLSLCSPTPTLEVDFSLTYGDGDPFTLLIEDIGNAFLTCAERMKTAR